MKSTCTAFTLLIAVSAPLFAADPVKSSAADASARVAAATANCEKLKGTEKTACLRDARQADKGGPAGAPASGAPAGAPSK
jgi:hypothetical protein